MVGFHGLCSRSGGGSVVYRVNVIKRNTINRVGFALGGKFAWPGGGGGRRCNPADYT